MVRRLAPVVAGILLVLGAWYYRDSLKARAKNPSGQLPPASSPRDMGVPPQPPPRPPKESTPPPRSDRPQNPQVDRLIASVDWARYGRALLAFARVDEDSRRNGGDSEQDPEVLEALSETNRVLGELAKLLGVDDPREVLAHEKVAPCLERGRMIALGVTLSPEQERTLEERAREFCLPRVQGAGPPKDSSRLGRLAWDAERELRWDRELEKILLPGQFAQVTGTVGSDPFWGRQANRRELRATGDEGMVGEVEGFWKESFGLSEARDPVLTESASRFVREYQRQVAESESRFPGDPPREEQLRLKIALVQLQAEVERELRQTLRLTPLQQSLVEQGSGTVITLSRK